MALVYLDTSALGRPLLGEPDAPAILRALGAFDQRVASRLMRIERRAPPRDLAAGFADEGGDRGRAMKTAIILFADTDTPEGMGRMANALTTAKEFKEAGDEVRVVFDGAGVKWVPALADPDHKYHRALEDIRDVVAGACAYCSRAFAVKDEVENSDVPLMDEYSGHPSVRTLMADGFQVVTF